MTRFSISFWPMVTSAHHCRASKSPSGPCVALNSRGYLATWYTARRSEDPGSTAEGWPQSAPKLARRGRGLLDPPTCANNPKRQVRY